MALPKAHLVRGPANLVEGEHHLVYARVGRTFLPNVYEKTSSFSFGTWADHVTEMKESEWAGPGGSGQASGRQNSGGEKFAEAACYVYDLTDIFDWYNGASDVNVVGELARRLRIDVAVGSGSETWRCGYRTQALGVLDNDWTWLDTAPGITGVGSGMFELGVNLLLDNFLFIFFSFETYPEPAPGTVYGVMIGGTECHLHF